MIRKYNEYKMIAEQCGKENYPDYQNVFAYWDVGFQKN